MWRKKMCLSKVYVKEKVDESIVVEEAARIINNGSAVEVHSLFEERTVLEGYSIKEVNLMKNYVVLDAVEG
jgi:predicted RNA-binding protein